MRVNVLVDEDIWKLQRLSPRIELPDVLKASRGGVEIHGAVARMQRTLHVKQVAWNKAMGTLVGAVVQVGDAGSVSSRIRAAD